MKKLSVYVLAALVLVSVACNESPYMQGKRLFEKKCANCHMEDGSGLSNLIPPIKSSAFLGRTEVVCILYRGLQDTIWKDSTYLVKYMPSFKQLSTTEYTNLINYINHQWNPSFKEVHLPAVGQALKECR
jgi:mono/diheme cytochrome c family protein